MSKAGVLGYIVSFPIPEVISGINATMLGAQSVNPNIKVKIIWVNTWFDPGKEADAAKALLDQGADVMMQHTDSPAAMQIAAQRGMLAFGQDSDMIKFGPKAQLTSIIDNWGRYYIDASRPSSTANGQSTDTWGGLKSKMVVMAPYTNMPDDVKKLAMDTEAAINAGKLYPFKCPIVDQDGKTVECKGGDHLDDGQILEHELLRQGHRRQDAGQVISADCLPTARWPGGSRPDHFLRWPYASSARAAAECRRIRSGDVQSGNLAVFHHPAAADHDPVGAMGAAQHQRRERVAAAGKAQFVELEQREIGHLADRDLADVRSADAGGRALGRPAQARPCG